MFPGLTGRLAKHPAILFHEIAQVKAALRGANGSADCFDTRLILQVAPDEPGHMLGKVSAARHGGPVTIQADPAEKVLQNVALQVSLFRVGEAPPPRHGAFQQADEIVSPRLAVQRYPWGVHYVFLRNQRS
jgi:hypothetical protein